MAAGRGEFFRSLLEGFERKPSTGGTSCEGQPGKGRGKPACAAGETAASKRGKRRPKTKISISRDVSSPVPRIKIAPSKENFLEGLPPEILIKILSYLDAPALLCLCNVSKLFNQLANDDVVWSQIYLSEFGSQSSWKPKSPGDEEEEEIKVEQESSGHYKQMYFRTIAGQEVNKWKRELRSISPFTGLPRQTQWVLRNLNVSWELSIVCTRGDELILEQSKAYFFESSVIVRWSLGNFPLFHQIRTIQLHGVRREPIKNPKVRKPAWRSLMLAADAKASPGRCIGKDRLITLMVLNPGFIVGIWRGQSRVAFIMVSLHFHKLVERSLLGTPVCPYLESVEAPPLDSSDPNLGLHGYTLHFVLHYPGTEIMSGQLACHTVGIKNGWVEQRVIDKSNLLQHRSLSGSVKLPWKTDTLEGSVENCCIVSLTLLDEFQKPFWCVSAPIRTHRCQLMTSLDYSGEHFTMDLSDTRAGAKMKMVLVWLKEQKQFFLTSLTVYLSVCKVNTYFRKRY